MGSNRVALTTKLTSPKDSEGDARGSGMREIPAKIKPTMTRNGDNEVDPRRRHTSGLTLTVAKVTERGGQGRGLEGSEQGGRRERERERERETAIRGGERPNEI